MEHRHLSPSGMMICIHIPTFNLAWFNLHVYSPVFLISDHTVYWFSFGLTVQQATDVLLKARLPACSTEGRWSSPWYAWLRIGKLAHRKHVLEGDLGTSTLISVSVC